MHIIDAKCQLWEVADRHQRLEQGQNEIYIASPTVQIFNMSFVLKNSLSTFQRAMNIILSTVRFQLHFCTQMVSSSPVVGRSASGAPTDCTENIGERWHNIETEKCLFLHDRIDYLRHLMQPRGLAISTKSDCRDKQTIKPCKRDWNQVVSQSL